MPEVLLVLAHRRGWRDGPGSVVGKTTIKTFGIPMVARLIVIFLHPAPYCLRTDAGGRKLLNKLFDQSHPDRQNVRYSPVSRLAYSRSSLLVAPRIIGELQILVSSFSITTFSAELIYTLHCLLPQSRTASGRDSP